MELVLLLLQNPNVVVCPTTFTIGSSRNCHFPMKDQTISANLCKIKHTQVHPSEDLNKIARCTFGTLIGLCVRLGSF